MFQTTNLLPLKIWYCACSVCREQIHFNCFISYFYWGVSKLNWKCLNHWHTLQKKPLQSTIEITRGSLSVWLSTVNDHKPGSPSEDQLSSLALNESNKKYKKKLKHRFKENIRNWIFITLYTTKGNYHYWWSFTSFQLLKMPQQFLILLTTHFSDVIRQPR